MGPYPIVRNAEVHILCWTLCAQNQIGMNKFWSCQFICEFYSHHLIFNLFVNFCCQIICQKRCRLHFHFHGIHFFSTYPDDEGGWCIGRLRAESQLNYINVNKLTLPSTFACRKHVFTIASDEANPMDIFVCLCCFLIWLYTYMVSNWFVTLYVHLICCRWCWRMMKI